MTMTICDKWQIHFFVILLFWRNLHSKKVSRIREPGSRLTAKPSLKFFVCICANSAHLLQCLGLGTIFKYVIFVIQSLVYKISPKLLILKSERLLCLKVQSVPVDLYFFQQMCQRISQAQTHRGLVIG